MIYSLDWNFKNSLHDMEQKTIYELFDELNPCEKANFIDARLAWCSGGALCGEIHKRICEPLNDD